MGWETLESLIVPRGAANTPLADGIISIELFGPAVRVAYSIPQD